MTQSPSPQSTNLPIPQSTNPYVGPRTFTEKEQRFFFGREREARDLTARIVSERLLLFYAQSGAGKSSLLNARVIPRLRDEERFQALPVGRVSGELPAGVAQVDNIYAFNLMTSLDQSGEHPQRLAQVTLSDFLARLARETAVDAEGVRTARWVYKPEIAVARPAGDSAAYTASGPRFALVIDQFEEIITAHPGRWREREGFFRQLNQALLDDPKLWVVLSLREDYVASLDPYAELLFNRLRARFYMERMQVAAALDAIRRPAELAGRPFAPGVAEKLADDLRRVRVAGLEESVPGQYVEPVQLQVVCFQMWENLGRGTGGAGGTEGKEITLEDLAVAGDVDQALTQFYEETLTLALADPSAQGVSERQVRAWFDEQLITEAGTRGLVHQGERETGSLPNAVVSALQRRFLVRAEARGGDAWIELVHDRFVEPIRASNAKWFPEHLSALQRQAALWEGQKRSDGLLFAGEALAEAERWAVAHEAELEPHERDFLTACRTARKLVEREQRQNKRFRVLAIVAVGVAVIAVFTTYFALLQRNAARAQSLVASARLVLEETGDEELAALLSIEANRIDGSSGYEVWDAIAKREFSGNWVPLRIGESAEDKGDFSWSPDGQFIADTRIGFSKGKGLSDLDYFLTTDFLLKDTTTFESRAHFTQTLQAYEPNLDYNADWPSWSDDSRYVAFGYTLPEWHELRIWDTQTATTTLVFTTTDDFSSEWKSPNGVECLVLSQKVEDAFVVRAWEIIDGSVGQVLEENYADSLSAEVWLAEVCKSGSTPAAQPPLPQLHLRFDNQRNMASYWPSLITREEVEGTPVVVVWDESRQKAIRTLPLPFNWNCLREVPWSPDGRLLALDTCAEYVAEKATPFRKARIEPRVLTLVHVKSLMHPCDWVTRNLTENEWIEYVGMVPNRSTCDNLPSGTRPASYEDFSGGFWAGVVEYNFDSQYFSWLTQFIQQGALRSLHGQLWLTGYLSACLFPLIALFLLLLLLSRRIKEHRRHKAWIRDVMEETKD
jgi:hypothetical protein